MSDSLKGRTHTVESRLKMSASRKGRKGTPHTKESKLKLSLSKLGKFKGEDSPFGIGVINLETGIYYDTITLAAESTSRMTTRYLCKHLSGHRRNKTSFIYADEARNIKSREIYSEHIKSINSFDFSNIEYRKRLSESMKGVSSRGKNPRAKIVLDLNTGVYYDCLKDVADCFNINYSNLRRWIKTSSHYAFRFVYV